MDEDDLPETPSSPAPPAKPEIRIRDLTGRPRGCNVCGKPKPAFIEIEVDGVREYTCRECYEGEVVELVACRRCGGALSAGDRFCGKCGAARLDRCPACEAPAQEGDRFCGKCGAAITERA